MHQPTADLDAAASHALVTDVDRALTSAATAAADRYAVDLQRAVVRTLVGRRPLDADDIGANAALAFLRRSLHERMAIMADYPSPLRYAAIIARRTTIDFDRTERIQRCQGARLFDGFDGGKAPGRVWVSGDAPIARGEFGGESLFDRQRDPGDDMADRVVERLWAADTLDTVFDGCTGPERTMLSRVDGFGDEVSELASEAGCARETMSRRVNRVRRKVAAAADRFTGDATPTPPDQP